MKKIIALVAFLFAGFLCKSQSRDSVSLTVEITGLKKNKQFIVFAELMNESKKVIQQKKIQSEQTNMTIVFEKLPKGKYAFRFFQDEDGNGKMDFNFFLEYQRKVGDIQMTHVDLCRPRKLRTHLSS